MLVCTAIILSINFNSKDTPKSLPIEISYPNSEENVILNESEYKMFDGMYYVSLKAISSHPGISLIGDVEKMTLSLSETQNAEFTVGSKNVKINGNNVTLLNESRFIGGDLFIPVDFFDNYFDNAKTEISDKKIVLSLPEQKSFSLSSSSIASITLSDNS